ncbi:MAG: carboxyl transferase domain-containing protein, partial [Myxococcota bacterium]
RRLGVIYPYEILRMLEGSEEKQHPLHRDLRAGTFQELDLNERNQLVPVHRAYGENRAGVVVGILSHATTKIPEGMKRVWIASDPTMSMGALAEPECRRILSALELAEREQLPIEWLPVSAGARISMDSGTENLDWTARVLKKIVQFTQDGGQIHVIVAGVNVGAQSYWNAEATMLMHTKGILILTTEGSMVLTGKKALEYSGGVSAEDERGIGGFSRVMGPNGQAQYVARDLGEAYAILFNYYRYSYIVPGESAVRGFSTQDAKQRSILDSAYREATEDFKTVGEIFEDATNPGRKKPFAIREVMAALVDQDDTPLERFQHMRHAETAVVWDAHVGGIPVSLIGFESRPTPRRGRVPMDGPDTWMGGTLFPQSSKKVAWGINMASSSRPVVVLANLSGFDGSPESLRKLQLEMGAEIGRAVVNFQGAFVFVVIGRYHGGAYVVFSKALNPELTAFALEGTYASVIG